MDDWTDEPDSITSNVVALHPVTKHGDEDVNRAVAGEGDLTLRERAFVQAMIEGAGSQSAAYRLSYGCDGMSDESIVKEAGRVIRRPRVSCALTKAFERIEAQSLHTGASLSLLLEQRFLKMANESDNEASVLRALENIGKSGKVRFFLDISETSNTDQPMETVQDELAAALSQAFKA